MPPVGIGDPEHLRAEMSASGVDRAVLIQTSTFYRWDNRYLRYTASASSNWAVGVCTLDLDNPHSPEILRSLFEWSNIRGIRSIPVADGRSDHPGVRELWAEAPRLNVVIISLIPPQSVLNLQRYSVPSLSQELYSITACLSIQAPITKRPLPRYWNFRGFRIFTLS